MRKRVLTTETLALFRESFDYNPETGALRWKKDPATNVQKGYLAGRRHQNGHLEVGLGKTTYMVHHVVWALVYGEFPERTLVHVNRDKTDNRLANLAQSGFGPVGLRERDERSEVRE